jgi:hypothetical protein
MSRCDASDALLKLSEPHGGFLPGVSMFSPLRQEGDEVVVGPAYTVEYAFMDDSRPKISGHYVRVSLYFTEVRWIGEVMRGC